MTDTPLIGGQSREHIEELAQALRDHWWAGVPLPYSSQMLEILQVLEAVCRPTPTSAENAQVEPVAWRYRPNHEHTWQFSDFDHGGAEPLFTQDQLDAAVRAEREQIGFPEWATDEHIANGILEAAETIVQLVIHDQTHRIAEYTGVIKSHAGTLLTRRAHIAKFLAAAIREGE